MLNGGQRLASQGLVYFPFLLVLLSVGPGSVPSASMQILDAAVASAAPSAAGPVLASLPAAGAGRQARQQNPDRTSSVARPPVRVSYGKLPLHFEENHGQTDERVKYLARGRGYTLFLTPTEAVLALRGNTREGEGGKRGAKDSLSPGFGGEGLGEGAPAVATAETSGLERGSSRVTRHVSQSVLRMRFEGANPKPEVAGLEQLPGIVNYFIGNDPEKWRTHIATYKKVEYKDVYRGIDLTYYGNRGQLEYDLLVSPGSDPNQIKLTFLGAEKLSVNDEGHVVLAGEGGEVLLLKPRVYQILHGQKREIAANYVLESLSSSPPSSDTMAGVTGEPRAPGPYGPQSSLHSPSRLGIQLASYDTSQPLIIDPVLLYSSYLGGSGDDLQPHIALDGIQNIYVAGTTDSPDFPTSNPQQPVLNGNTDLFVVKMDPSATALSYATYLGGTTVQSVFTVAPGGLEVDEAGNAFIGGWTSETDFPMVNAIQPIYGGGSADFFATKLNADGSALVYSTYLGGAAQEIADTITVDSQGRLYLGGNTDGSGFPITVNALQPAFGGASSAILARLSATGSTLEYATYLGGSSGGADILGLEVDGDGDMYLVGRTTSPDFPTVNPIQAILGGGHDAFVAKLAATGSALLYSTYLGGSAEDWGLDIDIDAAGNAYVSGITDSSDFPVADALQSTFGGGGAGFGFFGDAFVAKLNPTGSALEFSTYLGGSGDEWGRRLVLDASGDIIVTGFTDSPNFPLVNPFQLQLGGSFDAYLAKITSDGSGLVYSTFLGGAASDTGDDLVIDRHNNVFLTGGTASLNFPITDDALQAGFGGTTGGLEFGGDAFVARICNDSPAGTIPGTWDSTANTLSAARHSQTATLLATGKVLIAGGDLFVAGGGLNTNSTNLYDPATNQFSVAGSLNVGRFNHTATVLATGEVLIAGGEIDLALPLPGAFSSLVSAERYDPATGVFTNTTGSLGTARTDHSATLLTDGTVLIVGGALDNTGPLASAEIYDPATDSFSAAADTLGTVRAGHTATRLNDGRVLIVGGFDSSTQLASAEIYDPATGQFSSTDSMAMPRAGHTATLLDDGRVLVVGGFDGTDRLASAELYDPAGGTFSGTGSLSIPRSTHSATRLSNGRVLVAGGFGGLPPLTGVRLTSVEIYDPAFSSFRRTGSLGTDRNRHTATLLPNGLVLVAGGISGPLGGGTTATAERYTPVLCGPEIFSLSPTFGPEGTSVTVTGDSFGATQDASTVTFNGVDAGTATSWSDTEIVVDVPAGATTGPVVVAINGASSNVDQTFEVTASVPDFTLSPSPGTRTIMQGQTTTYTLSLQSLNGFNEPVTLSVASGLPAGIEQVVFSPNPVTPTVGGASSTLTITTSVATPTGTHVLGIQGLGASQTHLTIASLEVTAAPVLISPTLATIPVNGTLTFGGVGGTPPYTFSLIANTSPGAGINGATGLYTAGSSAGTSTVRVTDSALTPNSAEATVSVVAAAGQVTLSLDGRSLGAGTAFTLFPDPSGLALFTGLSTTRVHDLRLTPGDYTLSVPAGTGTNAVPFRVTDTGQACGAVTVR